MNCEGKSAIGRLKSRWDNNILMDLQEFEGAFVY
jgi:hypothetical protein